MTILDTRSINLGKIEGIEKPSSVTNNRDVINLLLLEKTSLSLHVWETMKTNSASAIDAAIIYSQSGYTEETTNALMALGKLTNEQHNTIHSLRLNYITEIWLVCTHSKKAFLVYVESHEGDDESDSIDVEKIWEIALEKFPYDLDETSTEQGTLEFNDGEIEFSKEFTFDVGKLIDLDLVAGGWMDFRADDKDIDNFSISGWFGIALDGEFHDPEQQILGKHRYLMAYYDIDSQEWHLEIDTM